MLVERPFDDQLWRFLEDPAISFCGVDKPGPRRTLEAPGFAEVIEAGLGHKGEEYLTFTVHAFPTGPRAAEVSPTAPPQNPAREASSDRLTYAESLLGPRRLLEALRGQHGTVLAS